MTEPKVIMEHGVLMPSGGVNVRASYPGLEKIYPLHLWIRDRKRERSTVVSRQITVIEDWTEVTE